MRPFQDHNSAARKLVSSDSEPRHRSIRGKDGPAASERPKGQSSSESAETSWKRFKSKKGLIHCAPGSYTTSSILVYYVSRLTFIIQGQPHAK
jgi:hypothetical protein